MAVADSWRGGAAPHDAEVEDSVVRGAGGLGSPPSPRAGWTVLRVPANSVRVTTAGRPTRPWREKASFSGSAWHAETVLGERANTAVFAAALVVAVVIVAAEVAGTVGSLRSASASSVQIEKRQVARLQGINPSVLARLSALVPSSDPYTVEISPRLASSDRGQAFAAILRLWLLPRVESASRSAPWVIVWGGRARGGTARRVGLVDRKDPPVILVHHG
jgi:hypothetical protein